MVLRHNANGIAGGFVGELVSGQTVLSTGAGGSSEIVVHGATVKAGTNVPVIVQVQVLKPKELNIFSRRGSVQFSYRGETVKIAEGSSYHVLLDPTDDGASTDQNTKRTGRRSKLLVLIPISGAVAFAATIITLTLREQRCESPWKP